MIGDDKGAAMTDSSPAPHAEGEGLLREALSTVGRAAAQFAFYADEHRKKGTADGNAKAHTNAGWALELEEAHEVLALSLPAPPAPEREGDKAARLLATLTGGFVTTQSRGNADPAKRIGTFNIEWRGGGAAAHAEAFYDALAALQTSDDAQKAPPALADGEKGASCRCPIDWTACLKQDCPRRPVWSSAALLDPPAAPSASSAPSAGEGDGEWAEHRREVWLMIKDACTNPRALFENGWTMGRANALAAPTLLAERDRQATVIAGLNRAVTEAGNRELAALAELEEAKRALEPFVRCHDGIVDMLRLSGGRPLSPDKVVFQSPYDAGGPSGRLEWRHFQFARAILASLASLSSAKEAGW